MDPARAPLVVAARNVAAEYPHTAETLQALCHLTVHMHAMLPDDPLSSARPLPRAFVTPHKEFCEALHTCIAKVRSLAEGLEAWADDIERAVRETIIEARHATSNRSNPY